MNGYQRIQAALRGEPPDHPPVMLHHFMQAAREAHVTMAEFRQDPRALARSFMQSIEKYALDGVMVDVDTATLAGALSACRWSFLPTSPPSRAGRDWRASPMWMPYRRPTSRATPSCRAGAKPGACSARTSVTRFSSVTTAPSAIQSDPTCHVPRFEPVAIVSA